MKVISFIASIAGILVLVAVPIKLSLTGTTKADWDHVFPSWRKWLVIGVFLAAVGIGGSLWG